MRQLLGRLAIPVVAAWVLFGLIAAFVYSPTWKIILISVPAVVTVLALGLVVFALIIGEHFFGLWGALLAVPALSIAQSVFNHFRFESMPDVPPDSLVPAMRARSA